MPENDITHGSPPPNSRFIVYKQWYQTDDNGVLYAHYNKSDKIWDLLPNTKYTLNGYSYETNKNGSITRGWGTAALNEEERAALNAIIRGLREHDQRGHVFADLLNGAPKVGNLVPMTDKLNQGDYKKLELFISKLIAEGHEVREIIDPVYESDPIRPDCFEVYITIDGYDFEEIFINLPEAEEVLLGKEAAAEDADMTPAEERAETEKASMEPAEAMEEITEDSAVNMEPAVPTDTVVEDADLTPAVESTRMEEVNLIPEGFEEAVSNAASSLEERSAEISMVL